MIERTVKIAVDLNPQELAFVFCNMGNGNQADFFNEVAVITEKWQRPFCFQLQSIVDHERLTNKGRLVMEQIGEYGEDRIKEAEPALLEALEAAKAKIKSSQISHYNAGPILVNEALEIIDEAIALARGNS